jgi:hypothetical protein
MVNVHARFWGASVGAAVLFAILLALIVSTGPLGLESAADRERGWLLSLWTAGIMAICFGGAGLLSGVSGISFKDVAEAGSVPAAISARREARRKEGDSPFYNFAGGTLSAGAFLILLYFLAWLIASR